MRSPLGFGKLYAIRTRKRQVPKIPDNLSVRASAEGVRPSRLSRIAGRNDFSHPQFGPAAASSTSPRGVLHRSGPAWTGPFRRPSPGGAPCAEYLGRNVAAAPLRRFFGNGSSGRPDRAGSGARPDRGPRIRSEGGWRRRIGAGTRFVVACFRDGCPRSTAWGRDPRAGNTPPETFGKSGSSTVSGNDDTMQHAHRGTRPNVP